MKTRFYTIMKGNKFLPSSFMMEDTDDISKCIRFNNKKDAEEHLRWLRKDIDFRVAEVRCIVCIHEME